MRNQIILLAACLGFVLVGIASATPVWRTDPAGQPPTTYQMWTFDDDDNPAVPEVVSNAYGTPLAKLSCGHCETLEWEDSYKGREGVWCSESIKVILEIPNQDVLEGYKEIWVEAIFSGYLGSADVYPKPKGTTVIPLGQTITGLGNDWKKLEIGWRVEPNPYSETVSLFFNDSYSCGGYMNCCGGGSCVDSVVVDTVCVPEPATLVLLGFSSLVLLRKRNS